LPFLFEILVLIESKSIDLNNTLLKVIAIIPARLESTRLPRKILADINGKSMLQRVYEQADSAGVFDQIIIATDSEEAMMHCIKHNMPSMITSDHHLSNRIILLRSYPR